MIPSKEDGTRSVATKFKTEQGLDNKKNVKKTGLQKHHYWKPAPNLPGNLTGAMFCAFRSATFKKKIKRISGYVTLKYGHYTGKAIKTRQPNTSSRPSKPSDDDISDDLDGAKYWWKAYCKEMMAKKIT